MLVNMGAPGEFDPPNLHQRDKGLLRVAFFVFETAIREELVRGGKVYETLRVRA